MADNKQSREFTEIEDSFYYKAKPQKVGALPIGKHLNMSEAITGLKAIQREAKEATKALRELETVSHESYYESEGKRLFTRWEQRGTDVSNIDTVELSDIPTHVLSRELARRGIVTSSDTLGTNDEKSIGKPYPFAPIDWDE